MEGSGQTDKTPSRRRVHSRVPLALGVLSAGGVAAAVLTDWPLGTLSAFWSGHAMLTNLVSSAVLAGFTIAVIERWLHRQEERHSAARRHAEQQRLTVVRSAAYNAVARGPIAQRRIMWFLVHGGDLRRVPEFEISTEHVRQLRTILTRLKLPETSEHDVMSQVVPRPSLTLRLEILSADEPWLSLVHDVLLDVVHNFRSLIARWSALLLTTDESLRALGDLAEQAEELSLVFVEFDGKRPPSSTFKERHLLWRRAFANSVSLEEALIDKGGERKTAGVRFETPGRHLLTPHDRVDLERHFMEPRLSLRLYGNLASAA